MAQLVVCCESQKAKIERYWHRCNSFLEPLGETFLLISFRLFTEVGSLWF